MVHNDRLVLAVTQWHHCCKIVAKPTPFLPISFLENSWTCHLTSLTYMDVDWVSSSHNCDILYYCCNIHEIYNITQFISVLALRNAPNEAIEIKVFYFDFTSRLRLCTLYCDEILLKGKVTDSLFLVIEVLACCWGCPFYPAHSD